MLNKSFELKLEKFTYGGDVMGRLEDGRAVFVPFGLPGERVRVRLVEEKKNFARAELLEVLDPSPLRITPRCRHFFVPTTPGGGAPDLEVRGCGGCHYQHMPYEAQLQAKTEIVRDQLQRIGKIKNSPVKPMVACPDPWYYRNHIQFHLSEDGKLGFVRALTPDPSILTGTPPKGRGDAVLEITECHLPEPLINSTWPQLEFEPDTSIDRVALRQGEGDDLMLVLESENIEAPELTLESGVSVVHLSEGDALVMAGEDHLFIEVLGREFRVSAGSFFQVNTPMAEKMVEHILKKFPLAVKTIMDIYCGAGLFSVFLASRCERLMGIEASFSAAEDFAANLNEFDNVELYEGAAEDVIPGLVERITDPPYVLIDPPRAGVDKQVLDAIRRMAPPLIVYVSCDPSTLARDAARLIAGGYRLEDVTPFDLFPQTYHIETITVFAR